MLHCHVAVITGAKIISEHFTERETPFFALYVDNETENIIRFHTELMFGLL